MVAKTKSKAVGAPQSGPEASPLTPREVALGVFLEVAQDKSQPGTARVQAARNIAEMLGLVGKVQVTALDTGETREAEMTPEALDREILRLSGTRTPN